MPKRAVAAIVATTIALALLFSFRTPADNGSTVGPLALISPAPDGSTGPAASEPPVPAASLAPGATPTPAATKAPAKKGSGTFTGALVPEPFGEVQVQITMSGCKITDVTVLQMPTHGRSGFISQSVAPILQSEALAAQSANIDTVSGATYTSDAYAQSLQSAIDQAHG